MRHLRSRAIGGDACCGYPTLSASWYVVNFEHQIVSDNASRIAPSLKPGGTIVIEGFQEDFSKQIGRPLGYRVNELPRAFDQLRIVFYEDTIGPADWNGGRPAPIARFVARKERK